MMGKSSIMVSESARFGLIAGENMFYNMSLYVL